MAGSSPVASRVATVQFKGMTRSAFLLRSALVAGAVYGGNVVGPFVTRAFAQQDRGSEGDVEILNFALTLEGLEQTYYQEGLRQVPALGGEVQSLAEEIEANEAEHVDTLTRTIRDLGGRPIDPPELDFGDAFLGEDSFLELAQTFEETGVSAYNGAAPMIESQEVLAAAGSIVQVEGRHAGLVRLQRGEEPAPVAFEGSLNRQQALDELTPFITGGGVEDGSG